MLVALELQRLFRTRSVSVWAVPEQVFRARSSEEMPLAAHPFLMNNHTLEVTAGTLTALTAQATVTLPSRRVRSRIEALAGFNVFGDLSGTRGETWEMPVGSCWKVVLVFLCSLESTTSNSPRSLGAGDTLCTPTEMKWERTCKGYACCSDSSVVASC